MRRFVALVITLLMSAACFAQQQQDAEPRLLGPALPTTLNGSVTELSFAAEPEKNVIQGGISVGGTCDDNPLLQDHSTTNDCFLTFMPTINVRRATDSSKFSLNYAPGYSLHNHLSVYDDFVQSGGLDFTYRISPRWTIKLADSFAMTSGLGDLLSTSDSGTSIGPIDRPNGTVLLPIADQVQNTSFAELGYQPTVRTGFGVGGSYTFSDYSDAGGTTISLVNSRTARGNAFYTYRLSRRQTMGISYMFQRLWFDPGTSATVHGVAYSHSIAITPTTTFSLFIGPQYTETHGVSFFNGTQVQGVQNETTSWAPMAGGYLNVRRRHTAFTAGFTRRIGDGGGTYGASTITNGSAYVSQRLSREWTVSVGGDYGETSLIHVDSSEPIRTGTITAGVNRTFGRSFSVDVRYAWQTQNRLVGVQNLSSDYVNRNRIAITLNYFFSKLIGR